VKQQICADASIPVYIIVNLLDRVVEVYSQPLKGAGRYGRSETLTPGQMVELPAASGKTMRVPVRRLLP
jgi:hypothetical protein